jgi:hypothetical protein
MLRLGSYWPALLGVIEFSLASVYGIQIRGPMDSYALSTTTQTLSLAALQVVSGDVRGGKCVAFGAVSLRQIARSNGIATQEVLATTDGPAMVRIAARPGAIVANKVVQLESLGNRTSFTLVPNTMDVNEGSSSFADPDLAVAVIVSRSQPDLTAGTVIYPARAIGLNWIPRDKYADHCDEFSYLIEASHGLE